MQMNVAFYDPQVPEVTVCSLAQFIAANEDGIDPQELATLKKPGDFIHGGGGAAPEFYVVVIEPQVYEIAVEEDQIFAYQFGRPEPAPGFEVAED